ncbi:hypothetical protein [Streptomyces sp. NPDC088246]
MSDQDPDPGGIPDQPWTQPQPPPRRRQWPWVVPAVALVLA